MEQSLQKGRVIIVDDEPSISFSLAKIFAMAGYKTEAFTRPVDALDAAQGFEPDLLITDVMMPGMSGIQLAIALTSSIPECKVLLVSAHANTADLVKDAQQDGHEFLLVGKPIHPPELLQIAQKLLAGAEPEVATLLESRRCAGQAESSARPVLKGKLLESEMLAERAAGDTKKQFVD